jgi:hypothetical protein
MKVLSAGISKTGTMSLQAALKGLGYRCYNFADVLVNFDKGHTDMWNNFMEGTADMDWGKLYEDYDAAVDNPSNIHYKEIMKAFPDIKVILTLRDPEKWLKSLEQTMMVHENNVKEAMFLPRIREFQRTYLNSFNVVRRSAPPGETSIEWFNRHNREVQEYVPREQLLVYKIEQGWEPLCKFLGQPVPDEPFPHENVEGAGVDQILKKAIKEDLEAYQRNESGDIPSP